MKKSRLIALSLSLIMIIAVCLSLILPASAAEGDWIDVGNSSNDYVYSMAIVGDTQTLSLSDAKNYGTEGYVPRVNRIYDWIVSNKDSKKISLVMGLGDIVETWQSRQDWPDDKYSEYWDIHDLEWDLTKAQIEKLADAGIPFTLVRGNHDSFKAFDEEIGSFTKYTSQFTQNGGFYADNGGNVKYGTSFMKLTLGSTNWLVIQLDWAVTTAELDWASDIIESNKDHQVIITRHNYLYNDASVDGKTGSASSAVPNPNWDYSTDPTAKDLDPDLVFNPDGIWHRLISKHENIKLVLSGHTPNDNIQYSQLVGDNGNTITQLLVDPQSMDLDTKNSGGCGMVAMLYFREDGTLVNEWDGSTVDVEWYSTIKNKFHKASNQFTLNFDLYDGGVETAYGVIPAAYANTDTYPFAVFAHDVDIDEYFFVGAYENWTTSTGGGVYPSLSRFSGKTGVEMTALLRRDFTMANDTSYSNFGNISVTLNLDLNGHTFASDYNETAKKDMSIFQTNLKKNVKTTINVYGKEGSALLNGSKWTGMIVCGIASKDANGAVFTYNFNGIKIGYANGSESTRFVVQTYDGTAGEANTVTQNINFNDCTFDASANKPESSVDMFLLNEAIDSTRGKAVANVTVNGGSIIANDMTSVGIYKKNANDTITFNKGTTGEYTTFNLAAGASAPTETLVNSLGEALEYVSRGNGVYELQKATEKRGTIDVWLIAGQSNAAGYGSDGLTDAKYDSRYTNGFENILYYGAGDDNAKNSFVPLTVGLGNKNTSVGAEVGIAKMLGDSDTMNAVIKLGRGSSFLYPNTTSGASTTYGTWTSPTYVKNHGIDTTGTLIGALYNDFLETVTEAIALLEAQGYTPVIRGMWWMQGEAEASDATTAAAYPELLECLITDLRADIEAATGIESSDMPFVAGNILRNPSKDANGNFVYSQPAYLSHINAAQASVAAKLDKVYTVATAHLPQIDNWHFTADAQQYLGEQFVKCVVYSAGKYSVSLDGAAAAGTGFGAYLPGETVTVSFSGRDGWELKKAYFTVSGAAPVEITFSGNNATYTFTMPAADVTIAAETEDTGAVSTKYGSIPTNFANAEKYPFVVFKNGTFYAAYENWNAFLDGGGKMFLTDAADAKKAVLLLRRNYNTTEQGANSQSLFGIEGSIDFDLGGYTLTRGDYHLFQVMAKKESAKAISTTFNVYNGTILTAKSMPIAINTNTAAKADDHFTFTFTGVTFGFASGSTSALLVIDTYANGTYDTMLTVTFNDCTFDAKTNMPNKNVCIFDAEEDSGSAKSAYITVNGGRVIIGDSTKVTFARLGGSDKLYLGKGSSGAYVTFNIASNVTLSDVYATKDGEYLRFGAGVPESDGTYTYTLSATNVESAGSYGVIDNTLYPASEYPFALFQKQTDGTYIFKNAYKHYYDFLLDLRLNTVSVESVLYLRGDYVISTNSGDSKEITYNGTKYTNIDRYLYYLKAPLTIDLNGYKLTRDNLHSLQMMGNGVDVTITVKNGTLHTATGSMIPFNNTGAKPETTTLNFVNVTFTTANVQYPFIDAYTGGTEGTKTTANITFTDCVIDISNLSRSSGSKAVLFDLKDDKDWININVTFIGGKFISGENGYTNVNLFTVNGENDSLTFGANADGKYTEFSVTKGTAAPAYRFISAENGAALRLFSDFSVYESATADKTHNTYFLDKTVKISEYENLPASLTGYTFLLFNADKTSFVGYNTWYEIWYNIWTLRMANDIVVLLLDDYDTDNCKTSSQEIFAAKNITIDLNGHTLTRGNYHLFQIYEKGSNVTYTPNVTVKNGTICAKKNYGTVIYFNSAASASGVNLSVTFTFDGVTFTSTDSYTGRLVAEAHSTNGVNGITASLTFNGCDFIAKNGIDAIFTINETSGKYPISVTVNGGSITLEKNSLIAKLGDNDNLTFGKLNGAYTSVSVKSGVTLADGVYSTAEGIECVLVKTAENGGYAKYSFYPKVMKDFKIKTSVTLYTNFVYNVYIPAANVAGFTVNGKTVEYTTETIDGVEYYVVKVELPASASLSDIKLSVALNSGSTTVNASWTLSVYSYAKKVLADEYDDTTKTLMKDMLVYASAAHTYFGNTEAVSGVLAEIKTLLGDYTRELPTGEAKKPEGNTYFTDVAVYLGATPSFRFYLAEGYTREDFAFYVGGRPATVKNGEGYVEIVMYAYMMLDNVSFHVNGTDVVGTYNLYSYYEYAKTLGDANLIAIVEGLMKYAMSAKAYRDSGVNK